MFFDSLLFSANVTFPTILMMLLGIFLRRRHWVDDAFCETASKIVFNFGLPATLFLSIIKSPTDYGSQLGLVMAGLGSTLILYGVSEMLAARYIRDRAYRGIFVQGVFRSNTGVLGLALCINAYGISATAPAAVLIAVQVLAFNFLAVLTLTNSLGDGKLSVKKVVKSLVKNPLILGILLGIMASKCQIELPTVLLRSGDYIAQMTLPLALICTGASLNIKQLKRFERGENNQVSKILLWATFGRLIVAPAVMLILGKLLGLAPMAIGILFLMGSAPLAVATYAMVRAYGGDAVATANLIGLTTIGSMFVSSLGTVILRSLGWM